ncbi:hypothetical protein BC834DRAFT_68240 [Gloeopeniophorella convolvens]|nr:hypothetical protein BC834DRAFT_68240 [Gloeopeniophorella convolvens]
MLTIARGACQGKTIIETRSSDGQTHRTPRCTSSARSAHIFAGNEQQPRAMHFRHNGRHLVEHHPRGIKAFLIYALSFSSAARGAAPAPPKIDFEGTCKRIAATISHASEVFFPPSTEYTVDNTHAFSSNSAASACSIEPGSEQDIGAILRIIGSTRTPFAVKSGGHASNPGFSSTAGVQISMARFRNITVNSNAGTVELGPGLTWDEVYTALESTGVTVVGGRIPSVGVGGLLLGAGYSYISSQFGLGTDNIVGIEVVLPNGTFTTVTSEDEDLWFALRGGMNNFGIVTKFTLKSHPQGQIWGGTLLYSPDQLDTFNQAFSKFTRNNDTKAAAVGELTYASGAVSPGVVVFYDAPHPLQASSMTY